MLSTYAYISKTIDSESIQLSLGVIRTSVTNIFVLLEHHNQAINLISTEVHELDLFPLLSIKPFDCRVAILLDPFEHSYAWNGIARIKPTPVLDDHSRN